MKKWLLYVLSITLIVSFSVAAYVAFTNTNVNHQPVNYTFSVANIYPHDDQAFTEGLVYDGGILYESTGLFGYSSLRKVELETGKITKLISLDDEYFGEGITLYQNKIVQLTWLSQKAFVYDKTSFGIVEEFSYLGEGWGITHDDTRLIMSNGSAIITFLDPVTFHVVGEIEVTDGGVPVTNLNELEYVNGDIYANVWHEDRIAIISIQTGQVKGWINLTGLYPANVADPEDVLNGIAYDADNGRLFVTGKRWSQLFEIDLEIAQ